MHNSRLYAEVAKLGQRRWDEVPVLNGSQVQILPSAPFHAIFEMWLSETTLLCTAFQELLSTTTWTHFFGQVTLSIGLSATTITSGS